MSCSYGDINVAIEKVCKYILDTHDHYVVRVFERATTYFSMDASCLKLKTIYKSFLSLLKADLDATLHCIAKSTGT